MTQYVCCYVEHNGFVLLIEKRKPAWQLGKYNLPGGKVEGNETAAEAAARELFEEANLEAAETQAIGRISGKDWDVYVVRCVVQPWSIRQLKQKTSERVFWMPIDEALRDGRLIPNLRFIIPLSTLDVTGWVLTDDGHNPSQEFRFTCVSPAT